MHKRLDELDRAPGAISGGGDARRPGEPRLPVLLIVHQHQSSPGNVGNWFRDRGYPLDIRRPRYGDPLPGTMEGHAGAVIFGGPQSANDTDEFIRREIDWIRIPLAEDKPFLGICLGAQMLAVHLGGEVAAHPEGLVEHGYYPIRPTAKGAALFEWPEYVYQWHREGFEVPESGELLAEGEHFGGQAFRHGSAYAVQFHPEITHLIMNRWVTRSGYRLVMPGARPAPTHLPNHYRYGPAQRRWLDRFLTQWARRPAGADKQETLSS